MLDRERRRAQCRADLRRFKVEAAGPCWVVVRDDDGLLFDFANNDLP